MKDPDCPNCAGRSFDASGGDDSYYECALCERPTDRFREWYRSQWPEVYDAWQERVAARG